MVFDGMKRFQFLLAPLIEFGCGSRKVLPRYCEKYGITKALVVCDPAVRDQPMIKQIFEELQSEGIALSISTNVVPNPSDVSVDDAYAQYVKGACDGVIGIGGGSGLDVAKGVAIMACGDAKTMREYSPPTWKKVERFAPLILLPTTSGTGAEVNPWAMISNSETGIKDVGYDATGLTEVQRVAIVDPELTISMPPAVTAATGLDAFCQLLECYISESSNPVSDALALYGMEIANLTLRRAFHNGEDIEARMGMSLAAMMSTMAFPNAGLNYPHQLSTAVYDIWGLPHGIAVAVMTRAALEELLPFKTAKLARVAKIMGVSDPDLNERELAQKGVEAIAQFMQDVEIPTLRQAVGERIDKLDDMVEHLRKNPPVQGTPLSVLERIVRRSAEF